MTAEDLSAKIKKETAIGFRLAADSRNADEAYGIHLNPDKSAKVIFTQNDKVIVLADE